MATVVEEEIIEKTKKKPCYCLRLVKASFQRVLLKLIFKKEKNRMG